jgi:hypothetical protein
MKLVFIAIIAIIVVLIIVVVFYLYHKIKEYLTTKQSSSEITLEVSNVLKKNGTTNETISKCSYSIWFIVDEWTNNNKILFEKISENKENLFEVYFDDYINKLNIFLPELNSYYKKSSNCEITKDRIIITDEILGVSGATGTTEGAVEVINGIYDCMNICSSYSYGSNCNSFSYQEYVSGVSGSSESSGPSDSQNPNIKWDFVNGEIKGNSEYYAFMEDEPKKPTGICYLYSSSPEMPQNCFSGQKTETEKPYSVYDWDDFIYSNNIVSYKKEECSFYIPLQKWTSLIITIDDLIMEIYINGKIVKNCSLTKKIDNSRDITNKFIISPTNYNFKGSTMGFNYWNKCLSSSEIFHLSKKVFI